MISTARAKLWENNIPQPVKFKIGRKYVQCSDAVYTLPGSYVVKAVTPTILQISGIDVANWVNANLGDIKDISDKKGFNVMPYTCNSKSSKLIGPWTTFDCNYMASRWELVPGERVRVRVAPAIDMIAPSEFRVVLRAVDVMRTTNVSACRK